MERKKLKVLQDSFIITVNNMLFINDADKYEGYTDEEISEKTFEYIKKYANKKEIEDYEKYLFAPDPELPLRRKNAPIFCFKKILNGESVTIKEVDYAIMYGKKATKEEKINFIASYNKLEKEGKIFSKNQAVQTYMGFLRKRSIERERYSYFLCTIYSWNRSMLEDISKKYCISIETIINYAKKYAVETLNITPEELKKKRDKDKYDLLAYKEIFDKLLLAKDEESIEKIMYKSKYSPIFLKSKIHLYMVVFHKYSTNDEYIEIVNALIEKIEIYQSRLELAKYNENEISFNLKERIKVIQDFYSSDLDLESFCQLQGITKEKYIDLLKEARQDESINEEKVLLLVQKGVEQIDLIDYCELFCLENLAGVSLIDKMMKKRLIDYKIGIRLKQLIRKFEASIHRGTDSKEYILKDKIEIECKLDKSGFPIQGTGRILTNEEKEMIFRYLEQYSIPITNEIFQIGLKRYKQNRINIEKTFSRKRTS